MSKPSSAVSSPRVFKPTKRRAAFVNLSATRSEGGNSAISRRYNSPRSMPRTPMSAMSALSMQSGKASNASNFETAMSSSAQRWNTRIGAYTPTRMTIALVKSGPHQPTAPISDLPHNHTLSSDTQQAFDFFSSGAVPGHHSSTPHGHTNQDGHNKKDQFGKRISRQGTLGSQNESSYAERKKESTNQSNMVELRTHMQSNNNYAHSDILILDIQIFHTQSFKCLKSKYFFFWYNQSETTNNK